MSCNASADRYTEALRIFVPVVAVAKVKPFVTRCLADAKAGKDEGPQDLEVGGYVLTCDPQNPEGPQLSIQPDTSTAAPGASGQRSGRTP